MNGRPTSEHLGEALERTLHHWRKRPAAAAPHEDVPSGPALSSLDDRRQPRIRRERPPGRPRVGAPGSTGRSSTRNSSSKSPTKWAWQPVRVSR